MAIADGEVKRRLPRGSDGQSGLANVIEGEEMAGFIGVRNLREEFEGDMAGELEGEVREGEEGDARWLR